MDKSTYLHQAIKWVESKPVASLKAVLDNYDDPKVYKSPASGLKVQPDISFVGIAGRLHFSDLALKSDDPNRLVKRWKLLSTRASMKSGKLHLLAPKGHEVFARRLVKKHNINALIHSL